jgi:DNA-directed RNA polymerase subunit RPC12/RpoP
MSEIYMSSYTCGDCCTIFEKELRADTPVVCPQCNNKSPIYINCQSSHYWYDTKTKKKKYFGTHDWV